MAPNSNKSYAGFLAKIGIQTLLLVIMLQSHKLTDALADGGHNIVAPLFGLSGKLLNQMNKDKQPTNVIMSPMSIHQALSMVLLGSDYNSETQREILKTLGYSNMSDQEIRHCHQDYANVMSDFVQISKGTMQARRVYEQERHQGVPYYKLKRPESPIVDMFTMMVTKNKAEINANYEQDIKKHFHASISNIDDRKPATKKDLLTKLNDWAKEAGFKGPIMEEKSLDDAFEAILLTAIRVEGFWLKKFGQESCEKVFYNYGSKDMPVDGECLIAGDEQKSHLIEFTDETLAQVKRLHKFMRRYDSFNKLSRLNFRAINIPLQGGLSFAILEPASSENKTSGANSSAELSRLVEGLFFKYDDETRNRSQVTNLAEALDLLDRANDNNKIDYLRIPKFKFESDMGLIPVLKSIGLQRVFNGQLSQISNMTRDNLYIGAIKHKAFIETTKAGIKAAAVTRIDMLAGAGMYFEEEVLRIEVEVENPFMFVLRYQKMPLFVGQLTNLKLARPEQSLEQEDTFEYE